MSSEHTHKNEGEGSKSAARKYNRGASRFSEGGKVAEAADQARKIHDERPEAGARAEAEAKSRAREEDPELHRGEWWTADDQMAWDREVDFLRREFHELDTSRGWSEAAPAVRFGFAAASDSKNSEWGPGIEEILATRFEKRFEERPWSEARSLVRFGWDHRRRSR